MTRGWRAVASSIAVVVAGAQIVVTQPGYMQGLVEHAGRSDQEAGYFLSVEMTAFALMTIAMTILINVVGRRMLVGIALTALISGNCLSAALVFDDRFILSRILAGVAAGVLVPAGFSAIALTRNPDRYFGLMIACVLVYGTFVLGLTPHLFALAGIMPLFAIYGGFGLIALVALKWFPDAANAPMRSTNRGMALSIRTVIALGGMLAYFTAIGAFWAYASLIGRDAGLTERNVAVALSVSQVTGIAGAMVSVLMVTRFGRGWPLGAGILAGIVPMAAFIGPFGASEFLVMVAVYNFGWNLTHPYLLGTFASLDSSGRVVVYATAMQKIGLAAGPAIAASLINGDHYHRPIVFAISMAVLSLACVLPAAKSVN